MFQWNLLWNITESFIKLSSNKFEIVDKFIGDEVVLAVEKLPPNQHIVKGLRENKNWILDDVGSS